MSPRAWPRSIRSGLFFWACLGSAAWAAGQPYVPVDEQAVLLHIPAQASVLRRVRDRELSLEQALVLSRHLLGLHRSLGEPRLLGQAQGLLQPWWQSEDAPTELLLMRATIKQAKHDFAGALLDLDAALSQQPEAAQLILSKAVILRVLGRYADAAQACALLEQPATAWIGAVCSASVASLTGGLGPSFGRLQILQADLSAQSPAVQAWYWGEWVDMAVRQGLDELLQVRLPELLEEFPGHLSLRLQALEWHWLREDRASLQALARVDSGSADERVFSWLGQQSAEPESEQPIPSADHARAQAMLALAVGHPMQALLAAQRNWSRQKEPADTRLLARAAGAAADARAQAELRTWLQNHGTEDVWLQALLHREPGA